MIKLLSIAVIAGLLAESNQQLANNSECWTDWFDRDDPSGSGDWETLSSLRSENPGKICSNPVQIDVRTTTGLTVAATGNVVFRADTTTGFVCKNVEQTTTPCHDYRVRFSCNPPFCGGGVCWTKWFDRDNPSGTGDWEVLSSLRAENPGDICAYPLFIEAVTADASMTPAIMTGDNIYAYNPTTGFVCRKTDQASNVCRDYKVRFGCPCSY
ncbi:uncharacterized protein [Centroberyx affinis]|uniref:uncharacterized protein n=1 Tax=Centroberyx affinis TaxID=166261 RepID=UPI003A5BBB35